MSDYGTVRESIGFCITLSWMSPNRGQGLHNHESFAEKRPALVPPSGNIELGRHAIVIYVSLHELLWFMFSTFDG